MNATLIEKRCSRISNYVRYPLSQQFLLNYLIFLTQNFYFNEHSAATPAVSLAIYTQGENINIRYL